MLDKLDSNHLQQIISGCPMGMMLLDTEGKVSWMNDTMKEILGNRVTELSDKPATDVSEDLRVLYNANTTVHLLGESDFEDHWLMGSTQSLEDGQGIIQYFVDITPLHWAMEERDQLKSELDDVMMVDKETGMRNKKGLYNSLEPMVSRSRRYDRPLSLVLMRIDCLGNLTENNAALANNLLHGVSQLLHDQLRWADTIGRLDETDFLVVLPETNAEDAQKVVENMQSHFDNMKIEGADENFTVCAQFSVVQYQQDEEMNDLLRRARQPLKKLEAA